jgi:hypothetical protein
MMYGDRTDNYQFENNNLSISSQIAGFDAPAASFRLDPYGCRCQCLGNLTPHFISTHIRKRGFTPDLSTLLKVPEVRDVLQ